MNPEDRLILRDLAKELAEVAALPIQTERRELWKKHNSLVPSRPLILLSPEGSWQELLPPETFKCSDNVARGHERNLRSRLYIHEHFHDDTVIENEWPVAKVVRNTGWGLSAKHIPSTEARGAWLFDPVLKEPSDLQKLQFPEITYDEAATMQALTAAEELFGEILDVQLRGVAHISYHLMNQYSGLRGLHETMLDMHLEPQMLHDAMAFFEAGHHRILRQYQEQNLLALNNNGTYHNSGGNGYTDELPPPDCDPERIRPGDMWASAEAQEMAQVGPENHAEFVLQYEKRLLEPFALTGYGCCEDLSDRLDMVFAIPGIRRISISPFADVDVSAEQMQGDYIFSWKPHPAHLVGAFDEDMIRAYIRHTVEAARANNCVLEMILKDTHTCEHHPQRFDRWSQIAAEEAQRGA